MSTQSQKDLTPVVPRKYRAIFFMLVSCFALWGLLNNMTDNLVPAFKNIFTIPQEKAALVQVAFYGAYAVLAIFASILIEEFSSLTANSLNFLVNETFEKPIKLQAKIRYRHSPASATVTRIAEDKLRVDFDLPQRAITAGQSLVLYDGDTVVGGGIIE